MRRWNEQRIFLWFGPVVLLLLVNSFIAYQSIGRLTANSSRESRSRVVLLQLEGLFSTIKDAETGQRGYLLTADPAYLAPYLQATRSVTASLDTLNNLVTDDSMRQQLPRLGALVAGKMSELQLTIDLRQEQDLDAALAVVRNNSGKEVMDEIRAVITQMEQEEQRILDLRSDETQRGIQTTIGTVGFATALSIILLLLIGFLAYRDSAARQRATETLRQQREWFEVTLASIGDAVIATDTSSGITFMNSVAEELTGWSRDAAVGLPAASVFRIINEYTRAPVESPIAEVLRRNIVVGLANHTILIAKDGTERSIDDSGAPIRDSQRTVIGAVLVFRDISGRRRVEMDQDRVMQLSDALAGTLDQETILHALAHQLVPQIADICFVDLLVDDGSSQRMALTYTKHLHQGYVGEIIEQHTPFADMEHSLQVAGKERPVLVEEASDDVLKELARTEDDVAHLRSLGIRSVIVVPLKTQDHKQGVLTLVGLHPRRAFTHHDLQLAVEFARRASLALDNGYLYKTAQDAVRDREQFLSIAAHELRTPLTSLLGRAELLQRRVHVGSPLAERDSRSVDVVVEQAKRLNTMMSTLLDLSRIQTGHFVMQNAPVDVAALVQRLVEEFEPTLERHTLVYEKAATALVVSGDELRLEQVVVNLFQNAVKYSPKGGAIRISVSRKHDNAVISMSDEGIGIPAQALSNLFTRFYRAPNTANGNISGMGIGLYVVKEIVDLHNGTITVTSVENQGSTFTVTLPLIDVKASVSLPFDAFMKET